MFKIIGANGNTWYYDQSLSIILDQQKNPIDASSWDTFLPWKFTDDEYVNRIFKYRRLDPDVKRYVDKQRIHRLKIQLGLNCNYNCKYCCQSDAKAFVSPNIDLDNFFKVIKKTDLDWSKMVSLEL